MTRPGASHWKGDASGGLGSPHASPSSPAPSLSIARGSRKLALLGLLGKQVILKHILAPLLGFWGIWGGGVVLFGWFVFRHLFSTQFLNPFFQFLVISFSRWKDPRSQPFLLAALSFDAERAPGTPAGRRLLFRGG